MQINYTGNKPYSDYSQMMGGFIEVSNKSTDYQESVGVTVVAVQTLWAIPIYRITLIFEGMFNLFYDLFSGQFEENKGEDKEEKRLQRFVFNLVSIAVLHPLYLLSGLIQVIFTATLLIVIWLPTDACSSVNTSILAGIEWLNAKMYEGLAEGLGINEGKYLKDSPTVKPMLDYIIYLP